MLGDPCLECGSAVQKRIEAHERSDRFGKQQCCKGLLQSNGENQRLVEIYDERDVMIGVKRSLWFNSSSCHELTCVSVVYPGAIGSG